MIRRLASFALVLGLALPGLAADITVSAAASLQNAFADIGKAFEAANPGTKVSFNFGASGQLLQQIAKGAPADVFATADLATMGQAEAQKLILDGTRATFASNSLVLIVPADSSSVKSLAQLTAPAIKRIALGTPESVPAGSYAKEGLEHAGLWETLKPKYVFGQNVRQVVDYVARGEADAGFVYGTDALSTNGKVKVVAGVPIKKGIFYPIAVVRGTADEAAARRFVDMVRSDAGRKILSGYGFGKP